MLFPAHCNKDAITWRLWGVLALALAAGIIKELERRRQEEESIFAIHFDVNVLRVIESIVPTSVPRIS